MEPNTEQVELLIEVDAKPEAIQLVKDLATELPMTAIVRPGYARRSTDVLPWIVLIGGYPIIRLVDGFLEAAGADGYAAFKVWVDRLVEVRDRSTGRKGTILYRDPESGIMVYLDSNLPEIAYRALNRLDFSSFESGPIRYHAESCEWLDIFEWKARSKA